METIKNVFNEVKKELEPELTEVSKIENNYTFWIILKYNLIFYHNQTII